VKAFSSCAKALPADAEQWDVSGLLLDGQPFSRETVQCWINCAYSALHGVSELDAEDKQQLSTAIGLKQVLAFGHAVGSAEALFAAACSQLSELKVVVQLPEQKLEVPVGKHCICFVLSLQQEQALQLC
jgi:hypothetical protein